MSIVAPTEAAIRDAADQLRIGQLVAVPTETVYGLAADALNPQAVRAIFAAKGRPANHPLIVHLPDAEHLSQWASAIPEEAVALARAFWPGPLTMILKRNPAVPDVVTGGQDTVGLRVPNHPVALALLRAFASGLAAPSANRFGRISPTSAAHVAEELGEQVQCILDGGACSVGIESTIIDLSGKAPRILRPGAISAEEIARVIGHWPEAATTDAARHDATPRVSGALAAHYAPRTVLELVPGKALEARLREIAAAGESAAVLARRPPAMADLQVLHWRQAPNQPASYAHDLYANLRALDALGGDRILVEAPDDTPAWQAVADRLGRAQTGSGAPEGA